MVGVSVHAIDHGKGRATQLVIQATLDQPADDRLAMRLTSKHVVGSTALDTLFRQGPMHPLDDIAA
ncbi:hypothetical protein D3C71_1700260 [compost metagenome]